MTLEVVVMEDGQLLSMHSLLNTVSPRTPAKTTWLRTLKNNHATQFKSARNASGHQMMKTTAPLSHTVNTETGRFKNTVPPKVSTESNLKSI